MASYTVRVELHGAQPDDYDELHERMLNAGYYRAFVSGDGYKYALPTAEYDHTRYFGDQSTVRAEVCAIADGIRAWVIQPWVMVSKCDGERAVRTVHLE